MISYRARFQMVDSFSVPLLYTVGRACRLSTGSRGEAWRHLGSECLKLSCAQKPFQQKGTFSSFELGHEASEKRTLPRSHQFDESFAILIFINTTHKLCGTAWNALVTLPLHKSRANQSSLWLLTWDCLHFYHVGSLMCLHQWSTWLWSSSLCRSGWANRCADLDVLGTKSKWRNPQDRDMHYKAVCTDAAQNKWYSTIACGVPMQQCAIPSMHRPCTPK